MVMLLPIVACGMRIRGKPVSMPGAKVDEMRERVSAAVRRVGRCEEGNMARADGEGPGEAVVVDQDAMISVER